MHALARGRAGRGVATLGPCSGGVRRRWRRCVRAWRALTLQTRFVDRRCAALTAATGPSAATPPGPRAPGRAVVGVRRMAHTFLNNAVPPTPPLRGRWGHSSTQSAHQAALLGAGEPTLGEHQIRTPTTKSDAGAPRWRDGGTASFRRRCATDVNHRPLATARAGRSGVAAEGPVTAVSAAHHRAPNRVGA